MKFVLFLFIVLSSDGFAFPGQSDVPEQLKAQPAKSALKPTAKIQSLEKEIEESRLALAQQKKSKGKRRNHKFKTAQAHRMLREKCGELSKLKKTGKKVRFVDTALLGIPDFDEESCDEYDIGTFPSEEDYDQKTNFDPQTGTSKLMVIYTRGNKNKWEFAFRPYEDFQSYQRQKSIRLFRETLSDMEWQFSFHILEDIFGFTQSEFVRNPLWTENDGHPEFKMALDTIMYLFNEMDSQRYLPMLLAQHNEILFFYQRSPYLESLIANKMFKSCGTKKSSGMSSKEYRRKKADVRENIITKNRISFRCCGYCIQRITRNCGVWSFRSYKR
jgi:hypothetical protein